MPTDNLTPKNASSDFKRYGNCQTVPVDNFFPLRAETLKTVEAKKVCSGCIVREECLDYALAPPYERHGVWGGLSERERRRIRRQRGNVTATHGTISRYNAGCRCEACIGKATLLRVVA